MFFIVNTVYPTKHRPFVNPGFESAINLQGDYEEQRWSTVSGRLVFWRGTTYPLSGR